MPFWMPASLRTPSRVSAVVRFFFSLFPVPFSQMSCETETAAKTGMVMIFGEITTKAKVNYEQVVRDAIKKIGYDDEKKGLNYAVRAPCFRSEG